MPLSLRATILPPSHRVPAFLLGAQVDIFDEIVREIEGRGHAGKFAGSRRFRQT